MKKIRLAVVVSVMALGSAQANDAGYAFLKIAPGGRASAMGAFTAVENEPQAISFNPAGLGITAKHEVAASHVELFENMRLEHVVFAHKALGGTMGYSLLYLNEGTMEGRDINRNPTGSFTAGEYAAQVNYAGKLGEDVGYGFAIKGLHSKIENESGTGFAVDVGVNARVAGVTIAASVLNFGKGPKLVSESSKLPTTLNAGLAWQAGKGPLLLADARQNIAETRFSAAIGAEQELYELFFIRGGYIYTSDNNKDPDSKVPRGLSAGFGLKMLGQRLDYAIVSLGELGYSHRITINLAF